MNESQISKTTIVSAFLCNANQRPDRQTDKYISLGEKLLRCNSPKVIFMDSSILSYFETKKYTNTIFYPIDKTQLFLHPYMNLIQSNGVNTNFPKKDTTEYMALMCNKTEFMRTATQYNPFQSDNFVWIDFGIHHVCDCNDDEFEKIIHQVTTKEYNQLRIASIINPYTTKITTDIYKNVVWYFAGGVFGGDIKSIISFANHMKSKCIQIVKEKSHIMWEVNIWYLVFSDNHDDLDFSLYSSNHNKSILTNY